MYKWTPEKCVSIAIRHSLSVVKLSTVTIDDQALCVHVGGLQLSHYMPADKPIEIPLCMVSKTLYYGIPFQVYITLQWQCCVLFVLVSISVLIWTSGTTPGWTLIPSVCDV